MGLDRIAHHLAAHSQSARRAFDQRVIVPKRHEIGSGALHMTGRMAYENLARRTGHEGVKAVTMALIQAERYGTPLGDALRVMSKENREMRMSAAEKKAAALPAQLTVPMILFFLPVLFLVVLGPAVIKVMRMQAENNA